MPAWISFFTDRSKSFRFESARTCSPFHDRSQETDALLVGTGLRFSLIPNKKIETGNAEGRGERGATAELLLNDFTFNAGLFVGSREKASVRDVSPKYYVSGAFILAQLPETLRPIVESLTSQTPTLPRLGCWANFISRTRESCLVTKPTSESSLTVRNEWKLIGDEFLTSRWCLILIPPLLSFPLW